VSSLPRRAVIEHDARLDILCCLAEGEPLAVEQVSGKAGMHPTRTAHHMRILEAFGLVGKKRKGRSGQTLYVARLEEHPPWVARAVNDHRQAD
jgi:DNA-binding transcriptional ArsR family regulator